MRLFEKAGAAVLGQEFADTLRTLAEMRQAENCQCKAEVDFVSVFSRFRVVGWFGPIRIE